MGWTAHVWRGEGVDKGFLETAVEALDTVLDEQVEFAVSATARGEAPGCVVDCRRYGATLDTWKNWLETNDEIRYGDHHMLVVDCVSLDFRSSVAGRLSHEPDTRRWGRSVCNAAVALLGENRFRNTVIHEFAHTCLDESLCPMEGREDGHSCGGVRGAGLGTHLATPMLVGSEHTIAADDQCGSSGPTIQGWTTDITRCTRASLESYHRIN